MLTLGKMFYQLLAFSLELKKNSLVFSTNHRAVQETAEKMTSLQSHVFILTFSS